MCVCVYAYTQPHNPTYTCDTSTQGNHARTQYVPRTPSNLRPPGPAPSARPPPHGNYPPQAAAGRAGAAGTCSPGRGTGGEGGREPGLALPAAPARRPGSRPSAARRRRQVGPAGAARGGAALVPPPPSRDPHWAALGAGTGLHRGRVRAWGCWGSGRGARCPQHRVPHPAPVPWSWRS